MRGKKTTHDYSGCRRRFGTGRWWLLVGPSDKRGRPAEHRRPEFHARDGDGSGFEDW